MNDAKLDQAALRVVALGMDVENFLQGPIGRHLLARAEEQRKEALEALKDADPENAKAIRVWQHKIGVIDAVQQWLADAITEARNAEQQLYDQGE